MAGTEHTIGQPEAEQAQAPGPQVVPEIAALLHPWERSRFLVAAIGTAAAVLLLLLLLIASGASVVSIGVAVLIVLGSVWWAIQLRRARLLGNAVRVTAETFPELDAMLHDLQRQLQYSRRVDVYVVPRSSPSIVLTTYLGTHLILIEGDLVADLLDPAKRPQLRFLIARHIGALKARQYRLESALIVLNAANALQFVKPFLWPYYRATDYSGDQIGLSCCGTLEAALEATGHLLVGRKLAESVRVGSVLSQASQVQRRLLPRFAQFLSPTPHVMNRYVNLLMWGRVRDSDGWSRVRATLTESEASALEGLWFASPQNRHEAVLRH
jgi:hypothetical protein